MANSKSHPTFQLIKQLKPTDKAHFKKFGFKSKSKQEDNFKILFDLIDKQERYNYIKLGVNKKLDKGFTKNLHANLHKLYQKILSALLVSKSENISIKFHEYYDKYIVLEELGLPALAEKELLKAIDIAEEHEMSFSLPLLFHRISYKYINKASANNEERVDWMSKLDDSVSKLVAVHELYKNTHAIENLIRENGGVVLKNDHSRIDSRIFLKKALDLIPHPELNFYHQSIIFSHIMLLESMSGEVSSIKKYVEQYIELAENGFKNIKKDHLLADATITFSLFPSYCFHLGYLEEANSLLALYASIYPLVQLPTFKVIMEQRKLNLDLLEMEFKVVPYSESVIQQAVHTLNSMNKESVVYHELLNTLLIVLMQQEKHLLATELTTTFLNHKFGNRVQDNYFTIKMIAALAWFKLEELDIFESLFRSLYRQLLQSDHFILQKELVLILKSLAVRQGILAEAKIKINKLLNTAYEEGSGYEKMRATELKLLAECL